MIITMSASIIFEENIKINKIEQPVGWRSVEGFHRWNTRRMRVAIFENLMKRFILVKKFHSDN